MESWNPKADAKAERDRERASEREREDVELVSPTVQLLGDLLPPPLQSDENAKKRPYLHLPGLDLSCDFLRAVP